MPYVDGEYISIKEYLQRKPAPSNSTLDTFGVKAAPAASPADVPEAKPVRTTRSAKAAKAAAKAATGVDAESLAPLPVGIKLADGETERPPVAQANTVSAHLNDADLVSGEDDEEVV